MQHQGGWAATFILVGIVLVSGLLGGVYYVKQHANNAAEVAKTPAVTSPDSSSTDNDKSTTTPNTTTDTSDETSKDTASNTTTPTTSTPTSDTDKKTTTTPPVTTPSTGVKTTELPQTGASDVLTKIVAISTLSFVVVAYLRSRAEARLSL